ncbi:hypothetical protein [Streptomyces sp. 6N223]|uniref:hypothetical protein n=1 Tax=Streptomyces sp. 6N223 TaxID=3457412 RepID=UPI003FCF65B6
MAMFGGRGNGRLSRIPLARDEPIERWQRRLAEAGLRLVEIKQTDSGIYQTLAGDDAEQAKDFLRHETVEKEQYYIVVETPDGNWGADINGLFLENLRPWQTDTATAECRGQLRGLIGGGEGIAAAAHGWVDNYLVQVGCGRCGHEWIDGIRFRDATLVRCPACHARNLVDSGAVTYTEFG